MNRIYSALAAVIKKHPILSAIPVGEAPERSRFVRLPYVNSGNVVKRVLCKGQYDGSSRDQELDELLETQLNISFAIGDGLLPFGDSSS